MSRNPPQRRPAWPALALAWVLAVWGCDDPPPCDTTEETDCYAGHSACLDHCDPTAPEYADCAGQCDRDLTRCLSSCRGDGGEGNGNVRWIT